MEGRGSTKTIQMGLPDSQECNILQESDSIIETDTKKVFRIPARNVFTKKNIRIFTIVCLILLFTDGLILWVTHFSDQNQRFSDDHEQAGDTHLDSPKVQTNQIVARKEKLLEYLYRITGNKTISGVFLYSEGRRSSEGVQVINEVAEVSPGIISVPMPSYLANADRWNFLVAEVISNWNNSHLVRVYWPWNERNPLFSMPNFTDTTNPIAVEERWNDLIIDGGNLNQLWKEKLNAIAPYLKQLQNAGVATIIDILPSINSKNYIWRGRPGVNGSAKLYKISHDHLTKQHNLTSLIWTWSLNADHMDQIGNFWPGIEYVDVASVGMWNKKGLSINEYQKLTEIVGDIPLSMEIMYNAPTRQLLAAQPRWTWFTIADFIVKGSSYTVKYIFHSSSVINGGHIEYFNEIY